MRCTEELESCMSPLHKRSPRTGGYTESIARARNVPTHCCGAGQQIHSVSPLLSTSSPRGWPCLWSMMCPAFPQPAGVSFLSCPLALSAQGAIQCLDNYGMLAGLILPGLARAPWEEGIWGKLFHCTAAAAQQLHRASQEGLQTLKQLHNLIIICLFQGCK